MADRLIRDELLNSERYWAVCDEAKLLYLHLILSVDDTARYSAKNFTLRTRCFPGRGMEPNRMESLLSELVDQDLIRLYHVNDDRYVFIPRFKQRLRYINSKYPEPPIEINDIQIKKTDLSHTEDSPKTVPSQQKRREVKRREENLYTDDFENFYKAYGKPVGKKKAFDEWKKIKPDADLVLTMIAKASQQAKNIEVKYRKDPERWIKDRRWEDQINGTVIPINTPEYKKSEDGWHRFIPLNNSWISVREDQVPQKFKEQA